MSVADLAVEADDVFVVHRASTGNVVSLRGLSVRLQRGEILAVVGPSGSGKSTMLACLAGTQRPTAGRLRVLGTDAAGLRSHVSSAPGVALVPQDVDAGLSPDLRLLDAVAWPGRLAGLGRAEAQARAVRLLERVGLAGRHGVLPAQLSGGERRLAAICAVLVRSPKLLLADEVTSGLDRRAREAILRSLRALVDEDGVTVVIVTHDLEAAATADRVMTVRDGRLATEVRGEERFALIDSGGVLRLDVVELERLGISGSAQIETLHDGIALRRRGPAPPPAPPRPRAGAGRADGAPALRARGLR